MSGATLNGHGMAGVNDQAVAAGHIIADTVRSHPRPGSNSVGNVVAAPLTAGGHPNSNAPGRHKEDDENLVAIGFATSALDTPQIELSPPLKANLNGQGTGSGPSALMGQGMAVRRLMPVECERLQGWGDGHTELGADGKLLPDSARYRLIGNGVAAPVAEWIGRRLIAADEAVAR
jgi:DNA (cytosine-5)-methyltransferase 1